MNIRLNPGTCGNSCVFILPLGLRAFRFLRMVACMTTPTPITGAPGSEGRKAVARAVISRRGELGLTQEALALKAGVSHRALQYMEAAETWPQAKTLAAIAAALGVSADDLRALADEHEPAQAGS